MPKSMSQKPTAASMYKEYISGERRTDKCNGVRTQIADSVLKMLDEASASAQSALELLQRGQTKAHINAGRRWPKTLINKIAECNMSFRKVEDCYSTGMLGNLQTNELISGFSALAQMAASIVSGLECSEIFGRRNSAQAEILEDKLTWIVEKSASFRKTLVRYTSIASIITIPPKKVVKAAQDGQATVLFEEGITALTPFFEQAKARGWKVASDENKADDAASEFDDGFALLERIRKAESKLLPSDAIVGISRCPIISFTPSRPPETAIKRFLEPPFNCNVYLLFNQYIVIDKMYLIGIHRSIMSVLDSDTKSIKIDIEKFGQLAPYAAANNPSLQEVITRTVPLQQARSAGNHYYCPLYPTESFKIWRGLKDWAPLIK